MSEIRSSCVAFGLLAPCAVTWISNERGYGLVALGFIRSGTLLWCYSPANVREFSEVQLRAYLQGMETIEERRNLLSRVYGYLDRASMILDDGVYFNHGREGNCITAPVENTHGSFAATDIEEGEELLENYLAYQVPEWLKRLQAEYAVDLSYL